MLISQHDYRKNVTGNANHKSWLTSPIRQKFHVIWCSTLKQWPYTWCYPFSSHWDAQYLHQTRFFSNCSLVTVTRLQSWRTTMRHVTSSFLKLSFGLQTTPTYLTTCKLFKIYLNNIFFMTCYQASYQKWESPSQTFVYQIFSWEMALFYCLTM